ncbi:MAG TPA: helix-turn-helix domain-containing protein [Hyphomonas sp.]|nr:helix-turn-helix domain-containing protein [Hyphomonas sp.]HRX72717.1 helix-turn-helix domain-containing protein [Hyphomonas sp.]
MSIEVMNLVFRSSLGSVARKAVMLAMADAANDDGSGIWRSAETIAAQCDLSKRTVFRIWKELQADGLIRRVGVKAVRGGEVIVWGIDCRTIASFRRPDQVPTKPDNISSPGDSLSLGDGVSPGDNDATDPVTGCHKPGDRVSPKPSLNHPIEPSSACVCETVDEILALLPKNKVRMAPRNSLPKVVKTILRTTPAENLLKAVKACYSHERHLVEDGQYAPAIYTFLQKGAWKGWMSDEESESKHGLTREDWAAAMCQFVDFGEWPIPAISPPPTDKNCEVPADMLDAWRKQQAQC